ncbi:MAG TPA: DUF2235 domain-containing protein [Geminicoccaceae bacterium]|nr:DUF2235 domain-containing protein [Geminicoccus sp.]HMU49425.1 DUF2235 domain-containing protein [Geminicoccaceae bacterium]
MSRKLVVCCDGTWNKPKAQTNIHRTFEFLSSQLQDPETDKSDREGWKTASGRSPHGGDICLFYDQGVGTSLRDWLTGGALGAGLSKNVCEAYHFLSRAYQPDSEIYIFGFSRGAYTARSLCGFIAAAGLLEGVDEAEVVRAYLEYYVRSTDEDMADRLDLDGDKVDRLREGIRGLWDKLRGRPATAGRDLDRIDRHESVKVRFIGVYDTVGSLGIPTPKLSRLTSPVVQFHNQTLGRLIEHAVHALAADERRGPYRPTIWSLPKDAGGLAPGQTCLQVWFPGVHSDVGGGYTDPSPNDRDKGIGDITWHFMMTRAAERGLVLDRSREIPLPLSRQPARQHESLDSFWKLVSHDFDEPEALDRAIGEAARQRRRHDPAIAAGREMLHSSLVERIGKKVSVLSKDDKDGVRIEERTYDPANLKGIELPLFREQG